jgi:putative transcriptional regulator
MAIVVNLDELLYARRMTLTELSDRVGITLANLSILKTGKAKAIRFSALDAICRQLGCQPGDLLAFNADGARAEKNWQRTRSRWCRARIRQPGPRCTGSRAMVHPSSTFRRCSRAASRSFTTRSVITNHHPGARIPNPWRAMHRPWIVDSFANPQMG